MKQGYFCAGSKWMEWDSRLHTRDSDIFISHNRPSAFWGDGLPEILKSLDIDVLLLCGLSVNNAVSSTARDAFARDIPTVVIKDCTWLGALGKPFGIYFEILDDWTAQVMTSEELLRII